MKMTDNWVVPYTEYIPVGAGVYAAQIIAVEKVEGQFGPQVKVTFSLTEPEHENHTLTGWCSEKYSPKSKLYKWAVAAGLEPKKQGIMPNKLINRVVRIVVEENRKSDEEVYDKITTLLPVKQPAVEGPPLQDEPPPMWDEQ